MLYSFSIFVKTETTRLNKLYFIFIFILFLSCNKNKKQHISESVNSDSISYYLRLIKSTQFTKEDKKDKLSKLFYLLKESNNTFNNRERLSNIALEYFKVNDLSKLKEVSFFLLKNSNKSKDSIHLAKAYRYLGGYYKYNQELDSSFYYYFKAEKTYFKLKDKSGYANMLFNKGIIQYGINDYLGAELSLYKAYYIFKDSDEKDKLYGTLNQLGLVYNELKEYDRSADFHHRALQTVREFNLQSSEHQEAVCYNNLGYLYIKQKKFKQASVNFELGLKDKTIVDDDPELYSSLIDNFAFCEMKINEEKGLPKLFFDALEVRKKIDNNNVVVGSYIHLSEYYNKKNDLLSAIKYSNKAVTTAKLSKSPINLILALKQASLVDKKNSLKYSEDYIRISDSLQIAERNSKDRFARLQLDTDEIIKEKKSIEESSRDILNYFVGTLAVIGFLFFMRTQRARRREAVLKLAQQQANEDIYKLIISQQGKLNEGKIMEKNRIAKELHDGVLGRLFGLRLNLDGLNMRTDEDAIKERIRCLEELKIIEQDLREISHELSREKIVLINNFVAIVNGLLEEQTKVNKAVLTSSIAPDIDWDLISNTTKINLYRVLQECLQNINKYAEAKTIKVDFKKDKNGNLFLNIVDDGIGFEVDKKSGGIGMKNIVARAHESDGTIEIKSEKNKGTRIKITVPLDHKSIKI